MKSDSELYDVIVIGGGASGMMAASVAAAQGKKVALLEKNKSLGEKLKITGGGRCNITNAEYDIHKFLKNYGESGAFLYSPFSQFGVKDTFAFFESRGLPLVVQARNRAFPSTEKALDVFNVLKRDLEKHSVAVKAGCIVKKFLHTDNAITGVETNLGVLRAKSYILATGGVSHPETGSTGDGFKWLANLGHTVKSPTPTIVPIAVADEWITMLPGISLSFMKITFFLEERKQFSKTGKVLFTHFGLSGPLILNSSSQVAGLLESGRVTATIDAFPDTDHGALDARIIKLFDANKNKILKTAFKEIAPAGTAEAIATLLPDIDFSTKVHTVSKEHRKRIVHLLKALPVTITHLMGYDRAVVADGGVALQEIDTKSMRSKIYANLHITGDLLHINRPSGGYSLQLCWTTGYVAGTAA
jgi:predicted Rossmann fold flavoprotein